MKLKIGDRIRFSQKTIDRFINDAELDKTARNFVFERKIHTVTRVESIGDDCTIWLDNIKTSMTGSWRIDLFPVEKIEVPQLDDELFTL